MTRGELSIIIPTLNAQMLLPRCLEALSSGLGSGLIKEVIIIDAGSTDHTLSMAGSAGCRVISSPQKGRGRQMHIGANNAKSDWFLFLHADTFLDHGWHDAIRAQMQFPEFAAAFTLAFDSPAKEARWLEKRAGQRVRALGLPYGDQGLLIHRKLYTSLGGFSDIPLMEDVEMAKKIGKSRLRILTTKAITSSDKYERYGWRKRAWKNAFLLSRYLMGASPEKLAKLYS
ncbi:TIGR04283 family arsenosugar biosynthesis glycosyltransferase [Hirschia litorea]|uniref:TIGR04283 family arsenosugar biosynthesis glycosyltransferase n=1 Tax=Hirschia litorea TaxID=1199156 RepID=A0ABW2IJI3_9PROT